MPDGLILVSDPGFEEATIEYYNWEALIRYYQFYYLILWLFKAFFIKICLIGAPVKSCSGYYGKPA